MTISISSGTFSAANADHVLPTKHPGIYAGEALGVGDACFIHTDGKVYQCDATDHTITGSAAMSKFDGFAADDYVANTEPVTLFARGSVLNYAASLTPGNLYWNGNTQGALETSPVLSGDEPVAKAVNTTDILVLR